MDISILVNLTYIAASILFIVGLKMLGSPDTARQGNFYLLQECCWLWLLLY